MKLKLIDFPVVANQWNYDKNDDLKPEDFKASSNRKVWWICDKGHQYEAIISTRTRKAASGCSYCAGKKICSDNCLQTHYPEVAAQWHPTKNDTLRPDNIAAKSNKTVWFMCSKGHEWRAKVLNRTINKSSCPYCCNKKLCADNSLLAICPEIAAEWHPTKNRTLRPDMVLFGCGKKVWWMCQKGHEWNASIKERTGKHRRGCPACVESTGEKIIRKMLDDWHVNYKSQHRFNSCRNVLPLPFDFFVEINHNKGLIEYQGKQHYEPVGFGGDAVVNFTEIKKTDAVKRCWCKDAGIPLLEIPYWELNIIQETVSNFIKDLRNGSV